MDSRRRLIRLASTVSAITLAAAGTVAAITLAASPALAAGTGSGYLHTSGNKIVDSNGATVRLTGLNWFGMETDNRTFHGLWANAPATWQGQINRMAELGFNTIRVPYARDALLAGATATGINDYTNPDLVGKSPLEILDMVIDYAGSKGMRIILDRHRPTAAGQTPLWYTSTVSEASMIADWQMLARRYANNPTVIGADLFNEPHAEGTDPNGTGACWGCGGDRDWRLGAQRIGNAILQTNPNWLIFVEGVSCISGGTPNQWDDIPDDWHDCDWWGGNLSQAIAQPVQLNVANRLVYSPHDYGISVYDRQPWFNDPNFPNNLPSVWDFYWGNIVKQNVAPVMVGEFGSTLANQLDVQWLTKLMSYLTANGMSFTYWCWNPNSGDTGGIVQDDWWTVNTQKYNILQPHLVPPVPSGTQPTSSVPVTTPPVTVPGTPGTPTFSGTTATSTTLSWTASSGTVTNYQIERCQGSTCGNFAQIATSTSTSYTNSGLNASTTYRYRVRATNSAGNSAYSGIGTVTTSTTPTTPPVTTTTPPVTTTPPAPSGGCAASYNQINSWPGGFQGEVTVTNTGTNNTTGWSVVMAFSSGQTITQLWSGNLSGSGPYTVTNLSWNGSLVPNGTAVFGFLGGGSAGTPTLTCTRTP